MTPNEYQALAMRTKAELGFTNNLVHAALLCTSEAGEIATTVKRHVAYGKELDVTNLKEEGGDLLWGIALLCETLGITMEEMMRANIAKLEARYPDLTFNAMHAVQRDVEKEAAVVAQVK